MGDPNASISTPQPVHYRPMYGVLGRARGKTGVTFVSQAALDDDIGEKLQLQKQLVAVQGHSRHPQEGHDPQRADAEDRGRPAELPGAGGRRRSSPANRQTSCRWRNAIFCSDGAAADRRRNSMRNGGTSTVVAGERVVNQNYFQDHPTLRLWRLVAARHRSSRVSEQSPVSGWIILAALFYNSWIYGVDLHPGRRGQHRHRKRAAVPTRD